MTSQLIIKSVLLVCVAGIGWMMLRSPGGARHQAGRRLVTLAFVLFAIVAIAAPSLTALWPTSSAWGGAPTCSSTPW